MVIYATFSSLHFVMYFGALVNESLMIIHITIVVVTLWRRIVICGAIYSPVWSFLWLFSCHPASMLFIEVPFKVSSRSQKASLCMMDYTSQRTISLRLWCCVFVRSDILTVTSTGSFENFSGRALSNSFRWICCVCCGVILVRNANVLDSRATLMYEIVISTSIIEHECSTGSSFSPWVLSSFICCRLGAIVWWVTPTYIFPTLLSEGN